MNSIPYDAYRHPSNPNRSSPSRLDGIGATTGHSPIFVALGALAILGGVFLILNGYQVWHYGIHTIVLLNIICGYSFLGIGSILILHELVMWHLFEKQRVCEDIFKCLNLNDGEFSFSEMVRALELLQPKIEGTASQIASVLTEKIVYSGPGIHRLDVASADPSTNSLICDFLLARSPSLHPSLRTRDNFEALLIRKNEDLLTDFRNELQQALRDGFAYQNDDFIFKNFVFNILGFLPYTYPPINTNIDIPIKIEEEWRMVTYRVDKRFEMTPSWFSSPLPVYGLLPDDDEAPPIFACLGTTYPAGDGFLASILSDCTPGYSVGYAASLYGNQALNRWLNGLQKQNVHATGISLGGSISLHLSRLHPQAISEVYAFNPAGQYQWNWPGEEHSRTFYHIFSNENDLVSTMGVFPSGNNVNYYRILSKERENFVYSHSRSFFGGERVIVMQSSTDFENQRVERIALTILHMTIAPLFFLFALSVQLLNRLAEIPLLILRSNNN